MAVRQLTWLLIASVASGLGGIASGDQARAVEAEGVSGFGRWESPLGHCQLVWPRQAQVTAAQSGCLSIRLDQTIEGMLRVRFISAAGNNRFASEELGFVGLLYKQDLPMQCQKGHCQPSWPMNLQVQGVATRRFDNRGLATQLPQNQLAQGRCRLSARNLWCEAQDGSGQQWRATAELRQQDSGGRSNSRTP